MNKQKDDFEVAMQSFSLLQSNSNARQVFRAIKVFGKADLEVSKCYGAYFAKSDRDGVPFHLNLIGNMPRDERFKCSQFVQEKLRRVCLLAAHTNHKLSRHSIDREIERYPGAVFGSHFGHSISGFPGLLDEMGACAWAVLDGDLTVKDAVALTQNNKYFDIFSDIFYLKPNPI